MGANPAQGKKKTIKGILPDKRLPANEYAFLIENWN
jgi:hypothetical protein